DWLCVNNVDEGAALRDAGHDLPVLVMGYVPLDSLETVVALDLRPVVYNLETLDRLQDLASRSGRSVRVHLKVETGTHRQGVLEHDVPAFLARLRSSSCLVLEGVTTHFANIEDTTDHSFAESQVAAFSRITALVEESRGERPVRHAACSAAALLFN